MKPSMADLISSGVGLSSDFQRGRSGFTRITHIRPVELYIRYPDPLGPYIGLGCIVPLVNRCSVETSRQVPTKDNCIFLAIRICKWSPLSKELYWLAFVEHPLQQMSAGLSLQRKACESKPTFGISGSDLVQAPFNGRALLKYY